jgi:hypothetical protein
MAHHLDNGSPHSDREIDGREPSPFDCGDQNRAKPAKAMLGIGLLFTIALALYGFNALHHSNAARTSAAWPTTYGTAHYAPSEDNSIQ